MRFIFALSPLAPELSLCQWFEKNYRLLDYDKILRYDVGVTPDYIMERNGQAVRVEIEKRSSDFNRHKHRVEDVDEVICIFDDVNLPVKTIVLSSIIWLNNIWQYKKVKEVIDKKGYVDLDREIDWEVFFFGSTYRTPEMLLTIKGVEEEWLSDQEF